MKTYNLKFEFNGQQYDLTAILKAELTLTFDDVNDSVITNRHSGSWSLYFMCDDADFEAFFCLDQDGTCTDNLSHIIPWTGNDRDHLNPDIHKSQVTLIIK